ncbi:hypothetical protein ACIRBX_34645 [Kitasatospora sp. NPDC096147]|uniref:hypothetical protein n=1 Tax=Kitasatospora sp. NPDC096147 TaxID=3364093 RepID=UPI0038065ED7
MFLVGLVLIVFVAPLVVLLGRFLEESVNKWLGWVVQFMGYLGITSLGAWIAITG